MAILEFLIPFLIILTVVVFVHELGHFLVARRNGVRVEIFSIGFGKELFGWNDRHGTRWRVSAVPIGGYVKMFGEQEPAAGEDGDSGEETRELTAAERAEAFPYKSVGQRAAIVAAGPAGNFIFAILVFALLFMTLGQPRTPPVVGGVVPDTPAAAADLKKGDRIVAINGEAVARFQALQRRVHVAGTQPLELTVKRGTRTLNTTVTPRMTEVKGPGGRMHKVPRVGIRSVEGGTEVVRFGPLGAVAEAVGHTWTVTTDTLKALGQIIAGERRAEQLGGPVRIAEYSAQAAEAGLVPFINFLAVLSINLGLVNLFPIPLLDGGHLLFYGMEAARGRPLTPRAQEYGMRLGFAVVIALMVFVTWNDLMRLEVWEYVRDLVS